MSFVVYILECSDKSLYTGCTKNIKKRLHAHNATKSGAKYTRTRRPVTMVFSQAFRSFSKARAREAQIKRMTRPEKLALLLSKKVMHTDSFVAL